MSSYRDDLTAAQARIQVLEAELDAVLEGLPPEERARRRRELAEEVEVAPPAPVVAGGSSRGMPEWVVGAASCVGALLLFAALSTAISVAILLLVRCGTG